MFIKKINKLKSLSLTFLPGLTSKINKKFKKFNKKKKIGVDNNVLIKHIFKEKIIRALHNVKKKYQIKIYKKIKIENKAYLMRELKKRLDYTLFISNIFTSINQAKQNIKHNYIFVNNIIVTCSSYILKSKSLIKIKKLTNSYKINNLFYFTGLKSKTRFYNYLLIYYIVKNLYLYNINNTDAGLNLTTPCFNNNKILINK